VTALADEVAHDLYVTVDEAAAEQRELFERLGFVVNRRESEYLIPTDPEVTGLQGAALPAGYDVVRADGVEKDRLRLLDDALRQDVPATDGWRWDPAGFQAETFESPFFDPSTYLIAVERESGDAGLVRVWNNPTRPQLGLIAVLPRHRRRGSQERCWRARSVCLRRAGRAPCRPRSTTATSHRPHCSRPSAPAVSAARSSWSGCTAAWLDGTDEWLAPPRRRSRPARPSCCVSRGPRWRNTGSRPTRMSSASG
jgi:hypothetical protein